MNSIFKFCREGHLESPRATYGRSCPAGQHRVLRGASWNNNERVNMRSSYRDNEDPRNRNDNNGLAFAILRLCGMASR